MYSKQLIDRESNSSRFSNRSFDNSLLKLDRKTQSRRAQGIQLIEELNYQGKSYRQIRPKKRPSTQNGEQTFDVQEGFRRQSCCCEECGLNGSKQKRLALLKPQTTIQNEWHPQLIEILLKKIAHQRNMKGKLKLKRGSGSIMLDDKKNATIILERQSSQKTIAAGENRRGSTRFMSKNKPKSILLSNKVEEENIGLKLRMMVTGVEDLTDIQKSILEQLIKGVKFKKRYTSKDDFKVKYSVYESASPISNKSKVAAPKRFTSRRLSNFTLQKPTTRYSRDNSMTPKNNLIERNEGFTSKLRSQMSFNKIELGSPSNQTGGFMNGKALSGQISPQLRQISPFETISERSPLNLKKAGSLYTISHYQRFGSFISRRNTIITKLARRELSICESDSSPHLQQVVEMAGQDKKNLKSNHKTPTNFSSFKTIDTLIKWKTSQTVQKYVQDKVFQVEQLALDSRGRTSEITMASQQNKKSISCSKYTLPESSRCRSITKQKIYEHDNLIYATLPSIARVYSKPMAQFLKVLVKKQRIN